MRRTWIKGVQPGKFCTVKMKVEVEEEVKVGNANGTEVTL